MAKEANTTIPACLLPRMTQHRSGGGFAQQKETGGYRELEWSEYLDRVLRLSSALRAQGIGAGDRVALLAENCPEWGIAALATLNLGACIVPIAAMSTGTEAQGILAKAKPKFCFFSKTTSAFRLLNTNDLPPHFAWDMQSREPLAEFMGGHAPLGINPANTSPEATAVLIYTSGTTGMPKGVPLSHKNILTNVIDITEHIYADAEDSVVSVLPMSHMLEFTGGFLLPIYLGASVTYVKSLRADDILRVMRERGCTILLAVPLLFEVIARTMEQKFAKMPKPVAAYFNWARRVTSRLPGAGKILLFPIHRAFGGKLRFFMAGGAKLPAWVYDFFSSLGIKILQGYGLTETAPVLSVASMQNAGPTHVGWPLRHVELELRNEQGVVVAEGEEGEVCVRGDSIFSGYENPEHNAGSLREGWFFTGDLGRRTPERYLEITGRKKDIIVTPGGKKVYPEELETLLVRTGKFLEVCVLGIKDAQGHEKITAVVRPDRAKLGFEMMNGTAASEAETLQRLQDLAEGVIATALEGHSDYMQPQKVIVWESDFPKTHTRKVKRFELREILARAAVGEKAQPKAGEGLNLENAVERTIGEAIGAIIKRPAEDLRRQDRLQLHLGLDSLTFVEVIGVVERKFLLKIENIEFAQVDTLGDLVQTVKNLQAEQSKGVAKIDKEPLFAEFSPLSGLAPLWRYPRMVTTEAIRAALKLFCRIERQGAVETLRTPEALIFTANHSSHFDSLSIVATLPRSRVARTFTVAAKDYFFDRAWKSFFFRLLLNAVPFDRKKRVDEGMRKCREIIDHDGSLIIFPEGTRSPSGKLQSFKPGVATLLCRNPKVRAVPVYIDGAYQVFPKGSRLPRPHKVKIVYGKPISFVDFDSTPENYVKVAKILEQEVEKLRQSSVGHPH